MEKIHTRRYRQPEQGKVSQGWKIRRDAGDEGLSRADALFSSTRPGAYQRDERIADW
jgi:hypothetical protein